MSFECQDAHLLIGSYADGELTEAQAAPLRQHLLSCGACRVLVQDQKALQRWFQPIPVDVPAGFAERIARRAFAGDRGRSSEAPVGAGEPTRIEGFLFRLASLAAAAAIVCAFLVQRESRPSADNLLGDVRAPSIEELRRELEELNADEPEPEPEDGDADRQDARR